MILPGGPDCAASGCDEPAYPSGTGIKTAPPGYPAAGIELTPPDAE